MAPSAATPTTATRLAGWADLAFTGFLLWRMRGTSYGAQALDFAAPDEARDDADEAAAMSSSSTAVISCRAHVSTSTSRSGLPPTRAVIGAGTRMVPSASLTIVPG